MAKDAAYRQAEAKIAAALKEGATELDLSGMELTEIPEAIANLTQLQRLDLSFNQIREIPEAITNLSQLQILNLSLNHITEIPEEIANLTQLQRLDLDHNQIQEIPEVIDNLSQLQLFSLSGNQIQEIPKAITNLTQLQQLNLSGNRIKEIPKAITNLTQLQQLNLYNNQITEISDAIANLDQLQQLNISSNKIIKIPEAIANLTQLLELNLAWNKLTELPNCIESLHKLQSLSISENEFTSFPKILTKLKELEELYAIENEINQLPEEIGNLRKLKRLYLGGTSIAKNYSYGGNPKDFGNKLKTLPSGIAKLDRLVVLELDGNPLNPDLAAAYEQGLDAVMQYLKAKAESEIILNEAKLILVGEGEVGKTSLLGALRGDEWIENRQTTHGVEVDIKSLVVTEPESKTEITLNGWDFGGQNIYRHTHQLFFTAPAIYLAVWNPRRGPEQCRVDEWIKMVKHRAYEESRPDERPRILVIATHGGAKERLDHIDEQTLRDEFGDLIVGFLHVDSKTESGLAELKQLISQTAVKIPQVGRTVPASWKRVLDAIRLRSDTDAWVSYEEFLTLCAAQEVDVSLAKTYAAILNELGHLIHYSTDPILKDTVILKPEWLSKAISFVLEDKQVKEQNGLVRHSHLSLLWNDPARSGDRYPEHLHQVFLKLMERCDLSYQVELPEADAPPTNLMAQLVPSKRPDQWQQDWILKAGDTEQTQICRLLDAATGRTAEAEGLMYRLIVRFHRYSLGRDNYYKSRHWKNGMLLDDGFNGRAFIEEIDGDIYVAVRAAYPSWFLGYLCSEITWLVNYFWKGLDPRLYIPCPTDSCKGLLERDEIIEFKEQGMPKVRCSVCRQFHNIDSLMATVTHKPEWQTAVTELKQGQDDILNAFKTNFDSLSVQLKTLMSQADEQYQALLTTLTDPAKDGPRLFSIEPVRSKFDFKNWTKEKFRITLWCEHKRVPLPILNGAADTRGVYEIELTRDWVKRASPLLRIMSVTLKLALPIAIPGTKLATDETEYTNIAEQLEFGVKSADSLIKGSEQVGDWLVTGDGIDVDQTTENTRNIIRAQGSLLRELHVLLKEKDPGFGGLERVQNKRRQFVWIHPQFIDEY
ncbi:MAG: COR domain-containing protein [Cyanobacteria bacterium P01_G01_bin.39]